ncbi:hypothetical protein LZC95_20145 [Pendulispora brunnea]|uniref:Co-chaperone DjlA N-terminal domain-containing protein n=1 Tax=Pendulispora brunnea TaxID=2905690 RepID=A0ABZ2KKD3_9BACT
MNVSADEMPTDDVNAVEARFTSMLAQIFADGIITDEERVTLWTAVTAGGLDAARVDVLLLDFLRAQFTEFAADGFISADERSRLTLMVNVLGISDMHLPPEIRRALKD